MSTPNDAAATPDPPSPSPMAGALRSEQTIQEVHTPEAAEILIAVRRLLSSASTGRRAPCGNWPR